MPSSVSDQPSTDSASLVLPGKQAGPPSGESGLSDEMLKRAVAVVHRQRRLTGIPWMFGLGRGTDNKIPMHVNGRGNPLQARPRGKRTVRTRLTLGRRMIARSAQGDQPVFDVQAACKHRVIYGKPFWLEVALHQLLGIDYASASSVINDAIEDQPRSLRHHDALVLLRTEPHSEKAEGLLKTTASRRDPLAVVERALIAFPHTGNANRVLKRTLERAEVDLFVPRKRMMLTLDFDVPACITGNPQHGLAAFRAAEEAAVREAQCMFQDQGGAWMVEVSRNRYGAYARGWVDIDGLAPQVVNSAISLLDRHLRQRYPKDLSNGFHYDAAKSRLAILETNPEFDEDLFYSFRPLVYVDGEVKYGEGDPLEDPHDPEAAPDRMTVGEWYHYQMRHAGLPDKRGGLVNFAYNTIFERCRAASRGILCTALCANLALDEDGGWRRLAATEGFVDRRDDTVPLVEVLRSQGLELPSSDEEVVIPLEPYEMQREQKQFKLPDNSDLEDLPEGVRKEIQDGNRNVSVLFDESEEGQARRWAAGAIALRHAGRDNKDKYLELALRLITLPGGPTTGPAHDRRVERQLGIREHLLRSFTTRKEGERKLSFQETDVDALAEQVENAPMPCWQGRRFRRFLRKPRLVAAAICFIAKVAYVEGSRLQPLHTVPLRGLSTFLAGRGFSLSGASRKLLIEMLTLQCSVFTIVGQPRKGTRGRRGKATEFVLNRPCLEWPGLQWLRSLPEIDVVDVETGELVTLPMAQSEQSQCDLGASG